MQFSFRHVLTSSKLFEALGQQRSYISMSNLADYSHILMPLVEGERLATPELRSAATRLVRKGLLLGAPDNTFTFISPLHARYYLIQARFIY